MLVRQFEFAPKQKNILIFHTNSSNTIAFHSIPYTPSGWNFGDSNPANCGKLVRGAAEGLNYPACNFLYDYFHNCHKEPCWTTHYSHWQLASTSEWAVWGYGGVCCLGGVRPFPSISHCCQCPAALIGQRFRGSTSWRESRTHRKEAVLRLHVCRRFGLFHTMVDGGCKLQYCLLPQEICYCRFFVVAFLYMSITWGNICYEYSHVIFRRSSKRFAATIQVYAEGSSRRNEIAALEICLI